MIDDLLKVFNLTASIFREFADNCGDEDGESRGKVLEFSAPVVEIFDD